MLASISVKLLRANDFGKKFIVLKNERCLIMMLEEIFLPVSSDYCYDLLSDDVMASLPYGT